jgi:hypothetical protein
MLGPSKPHIVRRPLPTTPLAPCDRHVSRATNARPVTNITCIYWTIHDYRFHEEPRNLGRPGVASPACSQADIYASHSESRHIRGNPPNRNTGIVFSTESYPLLKAIKENQKALAGIHTIDKEPKCYGNFIYLARQYAWMGTSNQPELDVFVTTFLLEKKNEIEFGKSAAAAMDWKDNLVPIMRVTLQHHSPQERSS